VPVERHAARVARSDTFVSRHWRRFWSGSLLERAVLVGGIAMVFGLAPVAVDAIMDAPLLDDGRPALEQTSPLESQVCDMVSTPAP
jgi:hypothetical protein